MTNPDSSPTRRERWSRLRAKLVALAGTADGRDEFVAWWYSDLVKAGRLSDRFKIWYYASVSFTSLAAATVPALIAFTTTGNATTANVVRIVAAVLGVLIAFATAVTGVVQVGNRWRVYRSYASALEYAGWAYLAGPDGDKAYTDFADAVTKARQAFDRDYMHQVATLQPGNS